MPASSPHFVADTKPFAKVQWQHIFQSIPEFNSEPDWPFWLIAYPALQQCEKTEQDPEYHGEGNVWIHTQMVVREMLKSDEYKRAGSEQQAILFLAALLHDIAKPITTTIDPKTQRIGHPNHSPLGAILVRELLWQQNTPFWIREEICNLIHNHQKPFYLMVQKNPLHLIHKLSWEVSLANLMTLARSDIKGRINVNNPESLARLKKLRHFIQQAGCLNKPCDFPNAAARRNYAYTKDGLDHQSPNKHYPFSVLLVIKLPKTLTPNWLFKLPLAAHVIGDIQTSVNLDSQSKRHSMFQEAERLIAQSLNFTWIIDDLSKETRQHILTWLYKFNAHIQIVYVEQSIETIEKRLDQLNERCEQGMPAQFVDDMLALRWDVPKVWEAESVHYIFT